MMTGWRVIMALMIVFGMAVPAHTGELVIKGENGWINWSDRTIHAAGAGRPPDSVANTPDPKEQAFMTAKRQAYQNLLLTANAMCLFSGVTVGDYVADKDEILSKLEQLLNNAPVENTRYQSEGSIEIVKRVSITGAFSQLILPENIVQLEMKKLGRETPDYAIANTGLVVDARGINLAPALCFRIMDEKGEEVYGPAYASREFAVQKGMCEYRTDIGDVRTTGRVGIKPLVIRGLRTVTPGGVDIVISSTDASRVRGTIENLFFLRECQVMVIIDPPAEKVEGGK